MNRPLKKATALLLTLCSLLALIVPPVSAATTYNPGSYQILKDGVIYNDFSISQYYGLGVVNGHDYLYVPYEHMLYVFDLDTWELVDSQDIGNGTSIGAFVDSKGIVWVYRATDDIYRYDPTTQSGRSISAASIMGSYGIDKLYSPIEVNGKLYFGTYGTAAEGGARIIEYNPNTNTWRDLGKLATDAMYCSAMTYHNGYIYATAQSNKAANTPQVVVKLALGVDRYGRTTITQVGEPLNIHKGTSTTYYSNVPFFDDIQVAGDILFIGGNHQTTMLAIDISGDTMKFADDLKNMPAKGGIQRCISEEVDGKIYFAVGDHRESESTGTWRYWNNLYSYEIATKTFTKLTSKVMPGDIRSQQKSIVTIENAELGLNGQYVLTMDMAPAPTVVLYGLDGSRHEIPLASDEKIANRLTSFTLGPDGKTIYMGSYMNNTTAKYDIATNTVIKTLATNSAQMDQNFFWGGKWYVTTYGGCNLSEIGADDTVTKLFSLNEGANKNYFFQERMHNFTAGGNKVFTSTVPHKGLLGGYIAWYDYDKKATYVAVEDDLVLYAKDGAQETWYNAKTNQRYTFTGSKFEGLVANQMVKTLVYYDGLIYASTTVHGGSQSTPKAGETAKLIVYDPTNMEMVATYDIREGISGLASNIEGITGIVADPDVPGRFWGLVSGTLFNFTFNKSTKTFNVREVLSYSKANANGGSPSAWSPWKCYFDDGYLYYYNAFGSAAGSVIMISTADPTYYAVIRADVGHRWVIGHDDNFYFIKTTTIRKYNTASIVAQVKANEPTAEDVTYVASNNGVNYPTVQAAIDAARTASVKTVILMQDTTENVTVPEGVTLDLNGKTLSGNTLSGITFNGTLKDSLDGKGLLKMLPDDVKADDGALLLYDSRDIGIGYRVYKNFTISHHGTELQDRGNDTKRLWIDLSFTNEDAYKVIATGDSEIDIGVKLSWTPKEGTPVDSTLPFSDENEVEWATKVQIDENYCLYVDFTGFKNLPTGTLKLTPTVNEVSSATFITYTRSSFDELRIECGVDPLPDWWQ